MIRLLLILVLLPFAARAELDPKAEARIDEQKEILSELRPLLEKKWTLLRKDDACMERLNALSREREALSEKLEEKREALEAASESHDDADSDYFSRFSGAVDEVAALSVAVDDANKNFVTAFAEHRNNIIRIEAMNEAIDPLVRRLNVITVEIQLCVIELGNPPPWLARERCGVLLKGKERIPEWPNI